MEEKGRSSGEKMTDRQRKRGEKKEEEHREMSLQHSVLECRVIITALLLPLCVLESQIQPQPISIHLY